MMEKYGTDMKNLPVTDYQVKRLNKIAAVLGTKYDMPKNREEADKLIDLLVKNPKKE